MTGELLFDTLRAVTGRRLPHVIVPEIVARDTRLDDDLTRTALGVQPPPFGDTVRDTVVWLVESGRMPRRYAGTALAAQS